MEVGKGQKNRLPTSLYFEVTNYFCRNVPVKTVPNAAE